MLTLGSGSKLAFIEVLTVNSAQGFVLIDEIHFHEYVYTNNMNAYYAIPKGKQIAEFTLVFTTRLCRIT
jgi:hypothetical protein